MQATMHIGIFVGICMADRINHRLRLLRRCTIVEIDQWLAIDRARQDREILANSFNIIGWLDA